MKCYGITLYMNAESDDGWDTKTYYYNSPKGVVKGKRLRIGWMFIRFGMFILYGNHGFSGMKAP